MPEPAIVTCPNCGKRNRVPAVAAGTPRCAVCSTPLPWLVRTGEDDFDAIVRSALPVLVDFWAPWCRPCDIVAPGVEQAAERLAGRLKVVKVDIDRAQDVGGRYGVRSIPTLLVLRDGKEVARQVGAVPPPRLLQWVEEVIQNDNQPAPSG
jgi:thioredoxin 2